VLGGGFVQGSLTLVGGDPGIGKSTLLLQICQKLGEQGKNILYVSGEESVQQIKIRADRLEITTEKLKLLSETNLNIIESVSKGKSRLCYYRFYSDNVYR
jgi:DNA repair protein RadA/Sms